MAGWGGAWSSLLRSLTIPQGAGPSDPRIFVGTDDPIADSMGQDAAIVFYWGLMRAFLLSVEDSGGLGEVGQIRLWGVGDRIGDQISQFISINYDRIDSWSDAATYAAGHGSVELNGYVDATVTAETGDIWLQATNDDGLPFSGAIYLESAGDSQIQAATDIRLEYGGDLYVQNLAALIVWHSDIARANANLDLTAAAQDLAGATLTVNGLPAGMRWEAEAFTDMRNLLTNATQGVVTLNVNGIAESEQVIFSGQSTGVRATQGQMWEGTIPSAGNYTFKLQGFRVGGADASIRVSSLHSGIRLRLYV